MSISNPFEHIQNPQGSTDWYEVGKHMGFQEGVKTTVQYLEGNCPCADKRGVAQRRIVDCPDCMAKIKKESGICAFAN